MVRELHNLSDQVWFSVSATTRARRPGEVDGRDYHFVSPEEFDRWAARRAKANATKDANGTDGAKPARKSRAPRDSA